MGFLSESVGSAMNFNSRPALRAGLCLNRLQRREPCTRCAEICPHGVFPLKSGGAMRWELCTDCSLCVYACPTRALIPSEPTRRDYAEALESAQVRITCRREADVGTLRVGCLASVPWELPAVFALRGKLCLYTRACASCPREMQRAAVTAAVEALKSFLGPGLFRERVQIVDGEDTPLAVPEETPEMPAVTRRELFGGIRRRAEKRLFREAEKRLPLLLGEQAEPLAARRLLAEAVRDERRENPGLHVVLPLPRFNLNCFGCGICAEVCPHQALSLVREEGGTRLVYIEPYKCTACSLCVGLCPHKGLDGLEALALPHLDKLPLVRVKSLSCESCGAVLLPGTDPPICRRCAKAAKSRK